MSINGSGGVRRSSIMVDVELEESGQWYGLDGAFEGMEVRLRSPHCDDFQRLQGSLQQKQRVFNASGEVDTVAIERIFRRAIGECLLIGWRGFMEDDGSDVAWSQSLATEIMRKQAYRKLSAKIAALVRKIQNDEEVDIAEEGKGSAPASDTTSA